MFVPSTNRQDAFVKDLFNITSMVALPIIVSVVVGKVRVLELFVIVEITGAVENVFAPEIVWAVVKST